VILSIIIPVYNTPIEKLQRCFDSIKYAPEITTEIIVVDDGSKACIGNFVKRYAEKDERFHYLYQENAGAGAARNKGLEAAKGSYVMFVDSDDTVIPQAISLCDFIDDADIIFFDGMIYEYGKGHVWKSFAVSSNEITKKDILYAAVIGRVFSPCKKLFRNSFLKGNILSFNTEKVVSGEDAEFVLKAVLYAVKMFYIEKNIYCYWHTFDGINDRIYRHPEQLIDYSIFSLRKEVLRQSSEFNDDEKKDILKYLISKRIDTLFNGWCSLFIMGKLDKNLQNMFITEINQIEICLKDIISNKIRIKYYLLLHQHWNIIKFLAVLRGIYLKYWARMK